MPVEAQVPEAHPMMIAWTAYKGTKEFASTRMWAATDKYLDGSLWAAFCRGWEAAKSS